MKRLCQSQRIGVKELPLYAEYMRDNDVYLDPIYGKLAEEVSGECILEVHSGLAMIVRRVRGLRPDVRIVTVEENPVLLGCIRRTAASVRKWTFALAEECALPFRDASFDTAISVNALHQWCEPVEALKELRRVVRRGGLMLLLDLRHDPQQEIFNMVLMALRSKPPGNREWLLRYFLSAWHSSYTGQELSTLVDLSGISEYKVSQDTPMTHTLRITNN